MASPFKSVSEGTLPLVFYQSTRDHHFHHILIILFCASAHFSLLSYTSQILHIFFRVLPDFPLIITPGKYSVQSSESSNHRQTRSSLEISLVQILSSRKCFQTKTNQTDHPASQILGEKGSGIHCFIRQAI